MGFAEGYLAEIFAMGSKKNMILLLTFAIMLIEKIDTVTGAGLRDVASEVMLKVFRKTYAMQATEKQEALRILPYLRDAGNGNGLKHKTDL